MKKKYIVPSTEVAHIELCSMIATSTTVTIHTNETVEAEKSLSNERRNNWGNIWND